MLTAKYLQPDTTVELPADATILEIFKRGYHFIVVADSDPDAELVTRQLHKVQIGETPPANSTLVGRCYPIYFYEVTQ